MAIYLGNFSIHEIEIRAGVEFPKELREYMSDRHQREASNIASGKWHCFDIPFIIVCGDKETADEIYKHFEPLSGKFKQPLAIGLFGS